MAPYFWKYPSIMYLDYEHNQRSSLRQLKYDTRDLTLFCEDEHKIVATAVHLQQLRQTCNSMGVNCGLSENDVLLAKFFDQNSDAAYEVFDLRMADLLEEYVPDSVSTVVYIKMIYYIMLPFRDLNMTPPEIVRSVGTGPMMMRLWKKYLELSQLPLQSGKGAAKDSKKQGCFITSETYTSLEIQVHATIDHQLAMFLHGTQSPNYSSPCKASTIYTEKFIGQSQCKTTHVQGTNQEPTLADTLDRATSIQFNLEVK